MKVHVDWGPEVDRMCQEAEVLWRRIATLETRIQDAQHVCETLADDGWVQVDLVLPALAPTKDKP